MTDNVPPTDAGKAREGLIDELETINNYEEMASKTSDPKLKAQFEEITDDERVHVGNFAEMISEKDPKAEPKMREGLKEAKEFEKTYRLYSIQEMMCGASHFEKVGTGEKGENYESRPGRNKSREKKEGQKEVNVRSNPYYSVRNGNIPTGDLPHSRAQDSEVSVIGGPTRDHVYVTPQDMGEDFLKLVQRYGPKVPFDYNGRKYITVEGSDGKQYVYVPDNSAGYEYRQLQWKRQRDGTYAESLVTPKMTEHRHTKIPEPMTPEIALKYYQNAQRDERVAKPKDRRDFITQALYDGKPPLDKWDVNAELEGGATSPAEYTDDSNGDPITAMVPGDVLNDYQQRKTEGRRIKEASKNSLFASSDALSYAMIKPSKFRTLFGDGSGDEKIFAIGEIVLGKERVNEIRNRPGNPEVNTNVIAKESARILGDPKVAPKIPNLLERVDNIVKEWGAKSPAFSDMVNQQKAKMETKMRGDNARVQREIKAAYDESPTHNVGPWEPAVIEGTTKEINGNMYTWNKERGWVRTRPTGATRIIPKGMSMDEAQGFERRNKDTFVPSEEGGAMPLSRVQNKETILPDELAFAAQRGSQERDEEANAIARGRRNQMWADEVNATIERDQKFGDLSGIQGKDDRNPPSVPVGAEATLMNARAPGRQTVRIEKPADWKAPEEDLSEYGQGEKLKPLGGVVPGYNVRVIPKGEGKVEEQTPAEPMNKSASFEEMLKSANARQWAEKGLPSGCMEATLPAYYRTVTIGSDRDAINVYEHKKMPVGGDGISVKKVPGIGPKMSTKGDE